MNIDIVSYHMKEYVHIFTNFHNMNINNLQERNLL